MAGIEDDVRDIRKMFQDHITNEATAFINNAKEHGVILTKLESIESRLGDGNVNFDDHETRIQTVEKTIANWRGWGAAIIVITGVVVKFLDLAIDKLLPLIQK